MISKVARASAAVAAFGIVSSGLQGCGGGGGGGGGGSATTTTITTTTKAAGPVGPMPSQDFMPIKGISYNAVAPQKDTPVPGDMSQEGYEKMFHTVRDDLGLMRTMGASSIRLYHGIGNNDKDHTAFLDRCEELGLNVIVDFHSGNICDNFDCFKSWKRAATLAFSKGFVKNNQWHPAVKMLVLADKPDLLAFGGSQGAAPVCEDDDLSKANCRTKAVLSALDGLLQAEADAKIEKATNVKITAAWSWEKKSSVNGKDVEMLYGFEDMKAAINDKTSPLTKKYAYNFKTPREGDNGYVAAYSGRWVNSMDVFSPFNIFQQWVLDGYAPYKAQPLMIAELNLGVDQDVSAELKAILAETAKEKSFVGAVFNGFQSEYVPGGPVTDHLFGLGKKSLATVTVYDEDPRTHDEHEVSVDVMCLEPCSNKQADAVAGAFDGKVTSAVAFCSSSDDDDHLIV